MSCRLHVEQQRCGGAVSYRSRCSFAEIHNEVVTDLLNPEASNLNIREDGQRGCYVEGLSEQAGFGGFALDLIGW